MNPIAASVARPYTVAVGVILVGIASWLAVARIPVQLKPTVDIPRISVTTSFRGASAAEVEEQVTRELEEVLQNVEGLVEMVSTSFQGTSTVTLEFEYGFDTRAALVDVINKLSQVPRLPPEADEPVVAIASARENEVVNWIMVASHYDVNRVRRIVEDEGRGAHRAHPRRELALHRGRLAARVQVLPAAPGAREYPGARRPGH